MKQGCQIESKSNRISLSNRKNLPRSNWIDKLNWIDFDTIRFDMDRNLNSKAPVMWRENDLKSLQNRITNNFHLFVPSWWWKTPLKKCQLPNFQFFFIVTAAVYRIESKSNRKLFANTESKVESNRNQFDLTDLGWRKKDTRAEEVSLMTVTRRQTMIFLPKIQLASL